MPSEGPDNPIFRQTKSYVMTTWVSFSCIQVDPILSDGLDPPGNVCPHCDLTQSGEHRNIYVFNHSVRSG